jgi:hypothetical protein
MGKFKATIAERITNCIVNCGIENQNIYTPGLVNQVRARIETDAFLISEKDGNKSKDSFYWNISCRCLIKALTEYAMNSGWFKDTFFLDNVYSFNNVFLDKDYTKHLHLARDDEQLALRIIEESNKIFE